MHASVNRENTYKLVPQHYRYMLQKCYFTHRVVPVWNSLPNDVVTADNIKTIAIHTASCVYRQYVILMYSRIVLINSGHHMILFIYLELSHLRPKV